jgi:hypothetical protein
MSPLTDASAVLSLAPSLPHVIVLLFSVRAIPRGRYSITMLQSTISTGSYILQKYSRSYPSSTSSQTQSQDQVAGQSEWQHFTNPPVLTLTLGIKKSADNKLFESVRLRIIWNLDDGAQQEIVMVRTRKQRSHICAFRPEV